MNNINITNTIKYIGANDEDIDLFENQYIVPNGMSYNSYMILDQKIAILDTIDKRKESEWLRNVENNLNGKEPDYLIISHMEPDHSYCIKDISDKYPNMKLVGSAKTFDILNQFFENNDFSTKAIVVNENDVLDLGIHKLKFIMAPMVHWPEVMFTYDEYEKVLFSADAFGKFGSLNIDEEWDCEARRYYFGIVGKYGAQVQLVLKKTSALDINIICPLHGPILKENLEHYLNRYNTWSKYEPEDKGIFIAYASIHGNTENAVKELVEMLKGNGNKIIEVSDLCREDWAECVEDAFRYDKLILAASSYNMSVFTPMYNFLHNLLERNYQNRTIGIIENGTWAPSAAKTMKEFIEKMPNIKLCENTVTIKSRLNNDSRLQLQNLANEISK